MKSKHVIYNDGKLQIRNIGGENVYYVKRGRFWTIVNPDKFSQASGDVDTDSIFSLSIPLVFVGFVIVFVFSQLRE